MEPFIYQKAKIPIFSLKRWQDEFPHLIVGFSARLPEEKDWNDSNYALHVGEAPDRVISNRKRLMAQLGMSFDTWTCGEQVHGTHIEQVERTDRGKGRTGRDDAFVDTDGLLTSDSDIFLASFYADCVPLFFYCPDLDIIGVAHAGWKGTVAGIGRKMVGRLAQLGADKKQMRIAIAPSIGPCCYQVDDRVINQLKQILPDHSLSSQIFVQQRQNQYKLDLKAANRQIFIQSGVSSEQIIQSNWCTSCHPAYFHSHRRDAGNTGRMVAWIGKKSEG